MDKKEIAKYLKDRYESNVQREGNFDGVKIKLLETTQSFARSFEYPQPQPVSVKDKFKRFIQKVIRKSTNFITRPYAQKNFEYQQRNSELSGMLIDIIEEQNRKINMLLSQTGESVDDDKLDALERKIADNTEAIVKSTELLNNTTQKALNLGERADVLDQKVLDLDGRTDELKQKLGENTEAIFKATELLNDTVNKSVQMGGEVEKLKDKLIGSNNEVFYSYSQCGEDSIIWFLLNYGKNKPATFNYLDIGCNHYRKINNTYAFYQMGMSGVLVEANPGFIDQLKENRPNDVVLNVGVGGKHEDKKTFYISNADGLSSFSLQDIEKSQKETSWVKVENEVDIEIFTVNEIIEKYFYSTPTLVSLDVEGLEMEVLSSIDFSKYRPYIFIIETVDYSAELEVNKKRSDIGDFMKSKGYVEYAFTGVNSIYLDGEKVKSRG